jgi:hypothetical protein
VPRALLKRAHWALRIQTSSGVIAQLIDTKVALQSIDVKQEEKATVLLPFKRIRTLLLYRLIVFEAI